MPVIRIGHSPDPDDAFMFHALNAGKVRIPGFDVQHVLEDIESLNRRARTAGPPGARVAPPGSPPPAALLLRLYGGAPPVIEVAFDKIPRAVLEGQAHLGLL